MCEILAQENKLSDPLEARPDQAGAGQVGRIVQAGFGWLLGSEPKARR